MSSDLKDIHRWFSEQLAARRSPKSVVLATVASGLAIVATFMVGYSFANRAVRGPKLWSTGPTIDHIQSLNQLVSTKVSISDVLTGEGEGVRGIWLIKGDALIGIDLSDADVQIPDKKERLAILHLRQPTVLSARVDHERTMTWDVQRTTWIPWQGDKDRLRDKAMYHAQKLVEFAANQPALTEEARRNASKALSDIYRSVDWQVEIRWR